jgi:hypothetical protein
VRNCFVIITSQQLDVRESSVDLRSSDNREFLSEPFQPPRKRAKFAERIIRFADLQTLLTPDLETQGLGTTDVVR